MLLYFLIDMSEEAQVTCAQFTFPAHLPTSVSITKPCLVGSMTQFSLKSAASRSKAA